MFQQNIKVSIHPEDGSSILEISNIYIIQHFTLPVHELRPFEQQLKLIPENFKGKNLSTRLFKQLTAFSVIQTQNLADLFLLSLNNQLMTNHLYQFMHGC
jgi:hypothetical protein